jgi:hypothetical protein
MAAHCQPKKEPTAKAVTLKDVQTKLYAFKMATKHVVYLNIVYKGKRKHQPQFNVDE